MNHRINSLFLVLCLVLFSCQGTSLPEKPIYLTDTPSPALPAFGAATVEAQPLPDNVSEEFNAALRAKWPDVPTVADKEIYQQYAIPHAARSANWLQGFDFSGVAWDQTRTCTLIGPRHVVMAKHYQRPTGSQIIFHDPQGDPVVRTLIDKANTYTDVTVGLLDSDATGCAIYPVLPAVDAGPTNRYWEHVLLRAYAFVTDQQRKALLYKIITINGSTMSIRGWDNTPAVLRESLVIGDSGNPSFLPYGRNQLALLTTSWTGGAGISGPDFTSARLQGAIRDAVIALENRNAFNE